jgi:hypothetical protein
MSDKGFHVGLPWWAWYELSSVHARVIAGPVPKFFQRDRNALNQLLLKHLI